MDIAPPELMKFFNGSPVANIEDWQERSSEILKYFQNEVYGLPPYLNCRTKLELVEEGIARDFINCKREQYQLSIIDGSSELKLGVLLYKPLKQSVKATFLTLNFYGNHTISADPEVWISKSYVRGFKDSVKYLINNRMGEDSRGLSADNYSIQNIINHGYSILTAFCGDICPDNSGMHLKEGVFPFFKSKGVDSNEWGAISAWAWGLSQIIGQVGSMDGLLPDKIILFGHSRLGKAALWAAAQDKRVFGVISNQSGCMGAKLNSRKLGETFALIRKNFPHWFCKKFNDYEEENIKVDQHCLLALIAPRPIYVTSAENDPGTDPCGQFMALQMSQPAYDIYGVQHTELVSHPPLDDPIIDWLAYHFRQGQHSVNEYDWEQFIKWADKITLRP